MAKAKAKTRKKGAGGRPAKSTRPKGKANRPRRPAASQQTGIETQPVLEANAAGVDIGAREMYVCVPADRDENAVRVFSTFTQNLNELVDWLVACGIDTIAMESTGVYWIGLYEIAEARGLRVCVVDARHMKNVPGRRTDWHECQWIQYLHSVGLLRAAFRPEAQVCALRAILRHRGELVQMAAKHVQHMHKALVQMNLQIQHVISDMTGVTGLAIIDAIVGGQRDAAELAKLRDPRIKAKPEVVEASLVGNWRPEHLFTLKQSRRLYTEYQQQLTDCDAEIERLVRAFEPRVDPQQKPLPPDRKTGRSWQKKRAKRARRNNKDAETKAPETNVFDLRLEVYQLFGVDVTQIPGLEFLALQLFSEVGRDMSRWKTAARFVSWLALCPDNDITGGRVVWRGRRRAHNRAGQLFRMAAYGLDRSDTPLGHFLSRMKAKLGPQAAYTATAHKVAVIFYTMIRNQVEYDETIWLQRDELRNQRTEARLKRHAKRLGYELTPMQEVA